MHESALGGHAVQVQRPHGDQFAGLEPVPCRLVDPARLGADRQRRATIAAWSPARRRSVAAAAQRLDRCRRRSRREARVGCVWPPGRRRRFLRQRAAQRRDLAGVSSPKAPDRLRSGRAGAGRHHSVCCSRRPSSGSRDRPRDGERIQIGGPAAILFLPEFAQIIPGENAGVMQVVEHQPDGVVPDRLDADDADMAPPGHRLLLPRIMALDLGAWAFDAQDIRQAVRRRFHRRTRHAAPGWRGPDGFPWGPALILQLAGFLRQHDGDAVADRIGQAGLAADQFVGGAVVFQRRLGQRADQNLQQAGIDGRIRMGQVRACGPSSIS